MKYMLLVCGDDTADASGMAPVEPWVEEHGVRGGSRLYGHRLRLPDTAVTVRVRDGEVLRTDGPFAETKEYVAGFDVVDCDSLEEAVRIAAGHPVATVGALEVRPFWDEDPLEDAEAAVRRIDAELTEAARERDVDRVTACYAPDAEVYGPADTAGRSGTAEVRKAVEAWFATLSGPVHREVLELRVRPGEGSCFSHALVRIHGTRVTGEPVDQLVRVTTGYRDPGFGWLIAHEHVSVPLGATDRKERS
ncbi:nuclear transport factor 2 family protein [Streptomyces arenae]|uniref:nuclear transport factor 2 family protein n=1 Tax=Streptomyces arenae TaxID=29301 RepID=UPI00265AC347|nr:nuclear transport factor 2 family protein [Streptomyces arenae]MCG7203252.1 nuclear transport factor 2 family protein [Streptomyces arenae]